MNKKPNQSEYQGKVIKLALSGSSHAPEVCACISGIPAGEQLDQVNLAALMARRAPGGRHATSRKEADKVEFLSGVIIDDTNKKLVTDGNPIQLRIQNTDIRSGDYKRTESIPRPGHADLGEFFRTGHYIEAGGGVHSARMTAPLLAAGGIVLQILENQSIRISTRVISIGQVVSSEALAEPNNEMFEEIEAAQRSQDSVGGVIELRISGVRPGLGGPLFDGLESRLAQLVFSIPAVKSFEIGWGKELSYLRGSQANDQLSISDEGEPIVTTSRMGGLFGGITVGQDIVVQVGFKPTPSISQTQKSVDLKTMNECKLNIHGRHDPCVALRARPVLEAVAAIVVYDSILATLETTSSFKHSQCDETVWGQTIKGDTI